MFKANKLELRDEVAQISVRPSQFSRQTSLIISYATLEMSTFLQALLLLNMDQFQCFSWLAFNPSPTLSQIAGPRGNYMPCLHNGNHIIYFIGYCEDNE